MSSSEFFDDAGGYVGPTSNSREDLSNADAVVRATLGRKRQSPRIEYGSNDHHRLYSRVRSDELLFAAGVLQRDQLHADADILYRPRLTTIMRDFIALAGGQPPPADQSGMVYQRALASSDFPSFVENVANKAATLGFNSGTEVYQNLINVREVPDFRPFTAPRAPDLPQLAEVPEAGAIPHVAIVDDGAESSHIINHSAQFTISRAAIINSDLQGIVLTPFAAGARARKTERAAFFSILSTNGALSDGENLFSSAHGNDDGSAGAPSTATLDAMRALFSSQTSPAGDVLNCRCDFLLGPVVYESEFAALRQAANSNDPKGLSTGLITTLTDASLSTASTSWYGFSDPARHGAITLFVLVGGRTPALEQLRDPPISAPDGAHYRLSHPFVMIATDYRGICRNAGA